MSATIRLANPDEYLQIAAIWDASWQSTGVTSPETLTIEQLAERLCSEVARGLTLYAIEAEAAICGLLLINEQTRQLSQIFLAPEAQGHGLGQACMDFTKSICPGGFSLTVAEANHRARRFYEREGLRETETLYRPEYERRDIRYEWQP